MDTNEIRAGVIATIRTIAPEVEEGELKPEVLLRDQADLDSMDWLNVIIGFHKKFQVDIPEADYAKLTTLDTIVAYLSPKLR